MLKNKKIDKLSNNPLYYNYIQNNFQSYIDETEKWLINNRRFISVNHSKELEINMPFHIGDKDHSKKAILLVHGLNDSPFTFHDIAKDLANKGFYVQALLLPGHGSKPEDLFLPNINDWEDIVYHYSNLLRSDYEEVWLGGFSTGANLITSHCLEYGGISGLLLFSPAFASRARLFEHLSTLIPKNIDLRDFNDQNNLAKYESAPLNGLIVYSESAIKVRKLLSRFEVTIPTVISISQEDSVVDSDKIRDFYFKKFVHRNSRLIWFGEHVSHSPRIDNFSMNLPEERISSASHMSITFDKDNFYYGKEGLKQICHNGLGNSAEKFCTGHGQVWYGAWAEDWNNQVHARLTWNPYYHSMMDIIFDTVVN